MTDATEDKKARKAAAAKHTVPDGQRYTISRQETRNGTDIGPVATLKAGDDIDLSLDVGQQLVIRADAAPQD